MVSVSMTMNALPPIHLSLGSWPLVVFITATLQMTLSFQFSIYPPQFPPFPSSISISPISQQNLTPPSPPFSRFCTSLPPLTPSNPTRSPRCFCQKPIPSLKFDDFTLTRVLVRGLPKSTSEGSLRSAFSQYGEVAHVKIVVDNKTRESLGFAYIVFSDEEDAQLAIKEMGGKFFEGRFICVTNAKPVTTKDRANANPYKL